MKNQVFVYITGNKITNKKAIAKAFNELKDGRYLITIEGHKNRSTQQNKYYHGCVLPLVKDGLRDIGYAEIKENEDAHEVLKYLFLKRSIPNEGTGEAIELLGSTTNLSTVEFNLFIDQIIQWAAEYLGIQIPLPNEPLTIEYKNDFKPSIID